MKPKSPQELRQMSTTDLRLYRSMLWQTMLEARYGPWLTAQREAWAPILRAIERSNESKAALVLKSGSVVQAILIVEFWAGDKPEDALVRLSVDRRNGRPPEEYMPQPDELLAYLTRLLSPEGHDPYRLDTARWEPV